LLAGDFKSLHCPSTSMRLSFAALGERLLRDRRSLHRFDPGSTARRRKAQSPAME
jgi:hypothetical protein